MGADKLTPQEIDALFGDYLTKDITFSPYCLDCETTTKPDDGHECKEPSSD